MSFAAGTAKIVITPEETLTLTFGMLSKGVEDDIHARVLTLYDGAQRLVFVTYDLNCLDVATPILRERCEDELDLPASHLFLLATHNHNSPIQIVPDNFLYGRKLADRLFDAIRDAIRGESGPVSLAYSTGAAPFVYAVGNAPADNELQVLTVWDGSDVRAILFNHPVHPLLGTPGHVGPGHPGYASAELERRYPGALALYGDACGGNQFPIEPETGGTAREKALELGRILADLVENHVKEPRHQEDGDIAAAFHTIPLPLADPLPPDEAQALARDVPRDVGIVPYPHPDRGTNWIRRLLEYHETGKRFPKWTDEFVCTDDAFLVNAHDDGRRFECRYEEILVSRIGRLCVLAMQGEVCAPIGMRIKDAYRGSVPMMVFGYMGEHNLYIPTRELVRQDAYQSQVLRIQYASPVDWDPSVEDVMVNETIARVGDLMNVHPNYVLDRDRLAMRRTGHAAG